MGNLMDFCYNVITHFFYKIFVSTMSISTMYKKVSHELETYMEQKTSFRVGDYHTGQEEMGLYKATFEGMCLLKDPRKCLIRKKHMREKMMPKQMGAAERKEE